MAARNTSTWENNPIRRNRRQVPITEIPRSTNKEFGSVFRAAKDQGPRMIDQNLPSWPDMTRPGNTSSNESAREIMSRWPPDMLKRFRIFMDSFKNNPKDYGPWVSEWLEKTAPGYDKDRGQIVKCKLELIKRLLHIKVRGPESLEDFCLMFLYQDHRFEIPQDIEAILRPPVSELSIDAHFRPNLPGRETYEWWTVPSDHNVEYPANMKFQGFTDRDRPAFYHGVDRNYPWNYYFTPSNNTAVAHGLGYDHPRLMNNRGEYIKGVNSRSLARRLDAIPQQQNILRQRATREAGLKQRLYMSQQGYYHSKFR